MKLTYKISVLNVLSGLTALLAVAILVSIFIDPRSDEEGWGMVVVALLGIVVMAVAILDFILQQVFRKRMILNILEIILGAAFYAYLSTYFF